MPVSGVELTARCACDPVAGQSCTACDGTAREYLADLLGLDADQLGEPCLGLDPHGWPCAARGENDGWCAEHSVLAADRLPVETPVIPAVAA